MPPPLSPRLSRALTLVVGFLGFTLKPVAGQDKVLQWNAYLRDVMQRDSATANPGWSTRALAMMNGAIHDCCQAVQARYQPLKVQRSAPDAMMSAAICEAGYQISRALYPSSGSWLAWAYGYSIAPLPPGAAKTAGLQLGAEIAAEYLAWRSGDGADATGSYTPGTQPGEWRPDPLFIPTQTAWGPAYGLVPTFCIPSATHFSPPAPPALTSAEYTAAFNEVKAFGARTSTVRNADQTEIGRFWAYDRAGMGPPPVLYSLNVSEIALQHPNSEADNARLFALVSVAMADAAIACWKAKFTHNFWRPTSGVREAGTDGNPATAADPAWEPLGAPGSEVFPDFTPPFPAYVSGHATMGQATFAVLRRWYGSDNLAYTLSSREVTNSRSYSSFTQAAQENADSRVYLGVHWRFDQTQGQVLGEQVADYVVEQAMLPRSESFPAFCVSRGLTGSALEDSDSDGMTDFAEYAFVTDPLTPGLPVDTSVETVGTDRFLVLRYSTSAARAAAGLTVVPQASADLLSWSTAGVMDEADPDRETTAQPGIRPRRARILIDPGSRRWLRLSAVQQ